MVEYMSEHWALLTNDDVFKQWSPFGIISGILNHSGVFDTTPLYEYITNIFKEFNDKV